MMNKRAVRFSKIVAGTRPTSGNLRVHKKRRGAAAVEFAVAGSLALLIIGGLMFLQSVVFHFHNIAALAREGARWAAVHGPEYESIYDRTVTSNDILEDAILPRAQRLNRDKLTCEAVWDESKTSVNVTVSYSLIKVGSIAPITVTSTSHMLISF
jgi:Flp pilus assembly pilin Flp